MENINNFINDAIYNIKSTVKNEQVLCGLSGGVDSAVTALLIHRAIGNNLLCVYVDNGLMRKGETEEIRQTFKEQLSLPLIIVDAKTRFLKALKGVKNPEQKRMIIGHEFINVFEEETNKLGSFAFLAQGTIRSDVIESNNKGSIIKSHHNVGGLPKNLNFKLLEPLKGLFKDQVRILGTKLGLPKSLLYRQPFPGPGLAIRIIGPVTLKKVSILQEIDYLFRKEIEREQLQIWQSFAVLTNTKTVGISNNKRTYHYTIALRAINSQDGMQANIIEFPWYILKNVVNKVTKIPGVGRVVYDITPKPPGTIEWE